jgi:hypothetical protein
MSNFIEFPLTLTSPRRGEKTVFLDSFRRAEETMNSLPAR